VSRAACIGACYGALYEQATSDNDFGVPLSWVSLLNDGDAVLRAVRSMVDLRSAGMCMSA